MIKISKEQACSFLIAHQGIHKQVEKTLEGVDELMKRIGTIQYDPLNVVGRNADLVLQARIKDYKVDYLHQLLYKDRLLVDGWDKVMSIYHVKDYANFEPVRQAHCEEAIRIMKHRKTTGALDVLEDLETIVRDQGPIFSRQVDLGGRLPTGWGNGKYSNVGLDYLFHKGLLAIDRKENAQRAFDLAERLLPKDVLEGQTSYQDDFMGWYVLRRIRSIGLLWNKSGSGWLGHFLQNKKERAQVINRLLEKGHLKPVEVEGINEVFYVHHADADHLLNAETCDRVSVIAPLDNLIWEREMIKALFNFSYTWEVYVPKAKRKYGYYVLPVLYKNRFIGRFEPDNYRGERLLKIKNWWWEEGIDPDPAMLEAVKLGLEFFCHYLGAKAISKPSYKRIFSGLE